MGKRGRDILIAAGMKPKKHAEPDGDESYDDDEDDYEPDEGTMSAAEDLCRALDVDESRAKDVAKAICAIIDSHK